MKILITGSNGQLGNELQKIISTGIAEIGAVSAEIKAADDKYETNTKQTFQQKGVTISLSSPVISAIQGVAKSAEMIGKSKHARVNAMTAANSVYNVVQAGQALGELAGAASGAGQAAGGRERSSL